MDKVERKQVNLLREMYFEYKDNLAVAGYNAFVKSFFNDYYTCLGFYCETYGYDVVKKSESLERKWDAMYRKGE